MQDINQLEREYKDFVYSRLNSGKEDNALLWLPDYNSLCIESKDAHRDIADKRFISQGLDGFIGESYEYLEALERSKDDEDIIFELGDVLFYVNVLSFSKDFRNRLVNIYERANPATHRFHNFELNNPVQLLTPKLFKLVELKKKLLYQEKTHLKYEICLEVIELLGAYFKLYYSRVYNISYEALYMQVIKCNIDKLNKRYPEGFKRR